MQRVLEAIEAKRALFEKHPFFTDLLDDPHLSGEERLAWAPCTVPFIMGYSDLNKYIFRNDSSATLDDPLQQMLNLHTYEEDFHWQWMLEDLERLGVDLSIPVSAAARVFWSPEMRVSRLLCLELAVMASRAPSFGVFAMVEAIEAVSITIFKHCRGVSLRDGTECEFFGAKHYLVEANHLIKSDLQPKNILPTLTLEQQEEALAAIDRVFVLFHAWCDSLLDYARKHMADPFTAYAKMVRESQERPRQAVFPTSETRPSGSPDVLSRASSAAALALSPG